LATIPQGAALCDSAPLNSHPANHSFRDDAINLALAWQAASRVRHDAPPLDTTPRQIHPDHHKFRDEPRELELPWQETSRYRATPAPMDTDPLGSHPENHKFRDDAMNLAVVWQATSRFRHDADPVETTPNAKHPNYHKFRDEAENLEVPWQVSPRVRATVPPLDTDPLGRHPDNHKFRDEPRELDVPWEASSRVRPEAPPTDTDPLGNHPDNHKFRDEPRELDVPWETSSRVRPEAPPTDASPLGNHPDNHKFRDEPRELDVPWEASSRVRPEAPPTDAIPLGNHPDNHKFRDEPRELDVPWEASSRVRPEAPPTDTSPLGNHPDNHKFRDEAKDLDVLWNAAARHDASATDIYDTLPATNHPSRHKFRDEPSADELELAWDFSTRFGGDATATFDLTPLKHHVSQHRFRDEATPDMIWDISTRVQQDRTYDGDLQPLPYHPNSYKFRDIESNEELFWDYSTKVYNEPASHLDREPLSSGEIKLRDESGENVWDIRKPDEAKPALEVTPLFLTENVSKFQFRELRNDPELRWDASPQVNKAAMTAAEREAAREDPQLLSKVKTYQFREDGARDRDWSISTKVQHRYEPSIMSATRDAYEEFKRGMRKASTVSPPKKIAARTTMVATPSKPRTPTLGRGALHQQRDARPTTPKSAKKAGATVKTSIMTATPSKLGKTTAQPTAKRSTATPATQMRPAKDNGLAQKPGAAKKAPPKMAKEEQARAEAELKRMQDELQRIEAAEAQAADAQDAITESPESTVMMEEDASSDVDAAVMADDAASDASANTANRPEADDVEDLPNDVTLGGDSSPVATDAIDREGDDESEDRELPVAHEKEEADELTNLWSANVDAPADPPARHTPGEGEAEKVEAEEEEENEDDDDDFESLDGLDALLDDGEPILSESNLRHVSGEATTEEAAAAEPAVLESGQVPSEQLSTTVDNQSMERTPSQTRHLLARLSRNMENSLDTEIQSVNDSTQNLAELDADLASSREAAYVVGQDNADADAEERAQLHELDMNGEAAGETKQGVANLWKEASIDMGDGDRGARVAQELGEAEEAFPPAEAAPIAVGPDGSDGADEDRQEEAEAIDEEEEEEEVEAKEEVDDEEEEEEDDDAWAVAPDVVVAGEGNAVDYAEDGDTGDAVVAAEDGDAAAGNDNDDDDDLNFDDVDVPLDVADAAEMPPASQAAEAVATLERPVEPIVVPETVSFPAATGAVVDTKSSASEAFGKEDEALNAVAADDDDDDINFDDDEVPLDEPDAPPSTAMEIDESSNATVEGVETERMETEPTLETVVQDVETSPAIIKIDATDDGSNGAPQPTAEPAGDDSEQMQHRDEQFDTRSEASSSAISQEMAVNMLTQAMLADNLHDASTTSPKSKRKGLRKAVGGFLRLGRKKKVGFSGQSDEG
jgi:hypothetical protein